MRTSHYELSKSLRKAENKKVSVCEFIYTIYGEVCINAIVASLCLSAEEFAAKDLNKDMFGFAHSNQSSSIFWGLIDG